MEFFIEKIYKYFKILVSQRFRDFDSVHRKMKDLRFNSKTLDYCET